MGDVGIVGAGTAGSQLALLLQQNGVAPTLYAERTADEVRGGRLPNTVIHNYRTRAREHALGVNHWDQAGLDIKGHWHYIPGERPLSFPGRFANPSLGVDYRIYQSALLEDFESRGGHVVYGAVSVDNIGSLGARHDLLVDRKATCELRNPPSLAHRKSRAEPDGVAHPESAVSGALFREGVPRQIDGEDAPGAGCVAHAEGSAVGLDAAPADRQSESDARPVRTALRERQKDSLQVACRQPAAAVADLD